MLTDANVHFRTAYARGPSALLQKGGQSDDGGKAADAPWSVWLDAWIKERRREDRTQWTASDLAKRLELEGEKGRARVRRWIREGDAPRPEMFRKVAEALALTLDELAQLLEGQEITTSPSEAASEAARRDAERLRRDAGQLARGRPVEVKKAKSR